MLKDTKLKNNLGMYRGIAVNAIDENKQKEVLVDVHFQVFLEQVQCRQSPQLQTLISLLKLPKN